MCIVRERRPAGFLDMKCQTCLFRIPLPSLKALFIISKSLQCLVFMYYFTKCYIFAVYCEPTEVHTLGTGIVCLSVCLWEVCRLCYTL